MPNPFTKSSLFEIPQTSTVAMETECMAVWGRGLKEEAGRFGTMCPANDSQLALYTEGQHLEACGHRNISVKGCMSPAEKSYEVR